MLYIIVLIIIFFMLAAVGLLVRGSATPRLKFLCRHPLSAPEQNLYWALLRALPDLVVLPQVAWSRFIYGKGKDRRAIHNKVGQKVCDYLICDKSFAPIAVVELDDKSHDRESDRIRDRLLEDAGIPTIRWNVSRMPTSADIQTAITKVRALQAVNVSVKYTETATPEELHEDDKPLPRPSKKEPRIDF